jgi:hypothetical protein
MMMIHREDTAEIKMANVAEMVAEEVELEEH